MASTHFAASLMSFGSSYPIRHSIKPHSELARCILNIFVGIWLISNTQIHERWRRGLAECYISCNIAIFLFRVTYTLQFLYFADLNGSLNAGIFISFRSRTTTRIFPKLSSPEMGLKYLCCISQYHQWIILHFITPLLHLHLRLHVFHGPVHQFTPLLFEYSDPFLSPNGPPASWANDTVNSVIAL